MKQMLKLQNFPTKGRSKWRSLILPLLLATFAMMVGCAKRVEVRTDFCTGWAPIYASRDDVLTDGTAKQILAHDRHGVDVGCWKAPAKKSANADSAAKSSTVH